MDMKTENHTAKWYQFHHEGGQLDKLGVQGFLQ